LENPRSVRAWLYQLTRGLAIDRVRKDVAEERRGSGHAEGRGDPDEGASFDGADAPALPPAPDALDGRHREVLVLHFLEEMTIPEIAGVVGCTEGTVKSRLHYAKKALQAVLQGEKHGHAT